MTTYGRPDESWQALVEAGTASLARARNTRPRHVLDGDERDARSSDGAAPFDFS
jgi:hypothetical protein